MALFLSFLPRISPRGAKTEAPFRIHTYISNISFVPTDSSPHQHSTRSVCKLPSPPTIPTTGAGQGREQQSSELRCCGENKVPRPLPLHSAAVAQAGRPAASSQQAKPNSHASSAANSHQWIHNSSSADMGSSFNTTPLSYTTFVLSRFQLLVSICGVTL